MGNGDTMTRRAFVQMGGVALGTVVAGGALVACAASEGGGSSGSAEPPHAPHAPSERPDPSAASPLAGYDGIYPAHKPYGAGIGAMPGRVVWAHDPSAAAWDGSGYWWRPGNFDEVRIRAMVDDGVARLAGAETAEEGWRALFAAQRSARGLTGGYSPGQKVAVKANINGSGAFDNDSSGETQLSYTNPVLLRALLSSLIERGGVAPGDIAVYDVSRLFPSYMVDLCTEGALGGVSFVGRDNGVADEAAPVAWSRDFSGALSYVPTCVTEATYLINLASLKGHSYGITLCGKNHFGSFINGDRLRPPQAANLHQWLAHGEMGAYSPIVDLIANPHLGGKTVLYLLDAVICAPSEGAPVTKENATWQQAPFSGGFTSSVLLSQDPLAIDSVGADLLTNEPTVTASNGAAGSAASENYLHEASLAAAAPSGTAYAAHADPPLRSLGVHEHWNNAIDKQYSRNLGKPEGIELIIVEKGTE